jgi:hypothetical protein
MSFPSASAINTAITFNFFNIYQKMTVYRHHRQKRRTFSICRNCCDGTLLNEFRSRIFQFLIVVLHLSVIQKSQTMKIIQILGLPGTYPRETSIVKLNPGHWVWRMVLAKGLK